ncbi:hypothetical protein [Actinomadura sp. 7K507]|uniref:arsenate reductase/protein-tyrosine-phosphatase family protein n=1 Tax=Actinomadura sp. 7K507 TaxID=2530365 RepID=UPI001042B6D1|nr:hypothetical protein [Actinomadura sp. 7K507]TDC88550.1 hypothetical protein E1285_18130 [Actinomadura sp. 7K507]
MSAASDQAASGQAASGQAVFERIAGRSQMAAALALARGGDGRVHARSPGTAPAAELELPIVEVMAEVGVDLSAEFPKPPTDELVGAADLLTTLDQRGI